MKCPSHEVEMGVHPDVPDEEGIFLCPYGCTVITAQRLLEEVAEGGYT